jgi:hypothetical protein
MWYMQWPGVHQPRDGIGEWGGTRRRAGDGEARTGGGGRRGGEKPVPIYVYSCK